MLSIFAASYFSHLLFNHHSLRWFCANFACRLSLSDVVPSLFHLPNSILWSCETPALTWHRWTSCLAAPHYSLSNDLNADRADVCLYSMPLRWPPVQRRSVRALGRKRKLILASRNDLLCSRFGLSRQPARHQPLISSLITRLLASSFATPASGHPPFLFLKCHFPFSERLHW